MHEDRLGSATDDFFYMLCLQHGLTVENDLVTLNGNNFTGIFVHKILYPTLQDTGCQLTAHHLLQSSLVDLDFLGKIEYLKNILIILKTNGTKKSRHRQLLLTVNISIHHIVDVRCKLDPRALEGNNTGRIELRAVGMNIGTKEHTRRTMQLRHHYTLRTINNKGAVLGHVRNRTKEHILNDRIEIFMIRVGAVKFQFSLQGNTVRQSALKTLIYAVAGRIDIIIEKFQYKVIASIRDREILGKDFVQAVILTQFRRSIELQEIFERL